MQVRLYHHPVLHMCPTCERCKTQTPACMTTLVQVYEQGKGLPFHFDKDEQLFKERQQMVHPVLSSVLYLTGAAAATKRMGEPACLVMHRVAARPCAAE